LVEFVHGNIFESGCPVLVNPVNCVGVMGAGLAKQFKYLFPDVFRRYKYDCSKRLLSAGQVYVYAVDPDMENIPSTMNAPKAIWCATTKYHWSEPSSSTIVEGVLDALTRLEYPNDLMFSFGTEHPDDEIGMPLIGAGLGGVKVDLVKNLIVKKLGPQKMKYKVFTYP